MSCYIKPILARAAPNVCTVHVRTYVCAGVSVGGFWGMQPHVTMYCCLTECMYCSFSMLNSMYSTLVCALCSEVLQVSYFDCCPTTYLLSVILC